MAGTHVTFGVLTAGVFTRSIRLEWSAFNGREPDENRADFDFRGRRIDSFAGRVSVNPSSALSLSAWYGYLKSPEALEPQESLHRLGGAVLVTQGITDARRWSSALIYGANVAPGDHWSNSMLLESSLDVSDANAVFGRIEFVQKSAAELALSPANGARYDVGEISLGYFRTVKSTGSLAIGVGARGTVNVVPPSLRAVYESRFPVGAVLFFGIRPARMVSHGGAMP